MFIKYGEEQHLVSLMNKGDMYYNPCKYFRDLEDVQKLRGIGDGNDGGMVSEFKTLRMLASDGDEHVTHDRNFSIL